MAAAALRRKSQLILNHIAPVTKTYEEVIKEKLELGKFPTTITGIIKIAGLSFIIFALSVFLAQPTCEDTSSWYPYLLPISLGITAAIQLCFFFMFACGATVSRPGTWIYSDILIILCLSLMCLVTSVLTYKDCSKEGTIYKLPGPLGMVGSIILVISCGSIFLMYRYNDDEVADIPPPIISRTAPRVPAPQTTNQREDEDEDEPESPEKYTPRKSLFV